MGAARTLLRKQAAANKPKGLKRGTRGKHVKVTVRPSRWFPYLSTFHATKGRRTRRIPFVHIFEAEQSKLAA